MKKIVMVGLFVFLVISFIASCSVRAAAPKVIKVATGSLYSLALWDDGTVSVWGRNNYGQVGNNSTVQQNTLLIWGLATLKTLEADL